MSSRLPWTKLQDFYLRLGFLKVLTAALSHERRSATIDAVIRRLERPLFDSISAYPALVRRTTGLFDGVYPKKTSAGKQIESPEVAEALVASGSGASALYGITRETAYKVLDWGRDIGLVGRANQITERGLILRSLLPGDQTGRFLGGDAEAWDPFRLDLRERLFFTFHLIETDLLTVALVRELGALAPGTVLESRDAARMTCAALFRLLQETEKTTAARDIPAYRTALDLALTIAEEVGAQVPPEWTNHAQRIRVMRSQKVAGRRALRPQVPGRSHRQTTKNADHQTIPRFEQLVDLGFVSKPDIDSVNAATALAARRRWKYVPTEACRRWAQAAGTVTEPRQLFQWCSFAKVAVLAFYGGSKQGHEAPRGKEIGDRLWSAYSSVGRSVGSSPVDSVALRAMLDAAAEGTVLEMHEVHRFLLAIKEHDLLTDCVFFASGNALDKMFIRLKPSFPDRLNDALRQFPPEYAQ